MQNNFYKYLNQRVAKLEDEAGVLGSFRATGASK